MLTAKNHGWRAPKSLYDRPVMTFRQACAIATGGGFLIWPALINGYPLLFSDTRAFLDQLFLPFMVWDKPWIYGPVLVIVSLKLSLWLPALAQGWLVSWVLWRVQCALRPPSPGSHLGLCLVLATGSAAPWFASLLIPDILAPVTVLALFLLAFPQDGRRQRFITVLASFAIAAHLTHLVIATACLAVILVLRPRVFTRAAIPLGMAVALLLGTNLVGHGRLGVSPFGAVFGLARLVVDGPARVLLEETCPEAGYWMCRRVGRLPASTETFLWDPAGPVWTFPGGPIALAPEASRIVTATILAHPTDVARAAADNTLTQLFKLRLDPALGANWLDEKVGARLRMSYPGAEETRFKASAQRAGELRAIIPFWAAPWQIPHMTVLALGAMGSVVLLAWSWRRDRVLFALIALIAAGVLANAFATGALSGPADRYQARVAWLVLLPVSMWARGRRRPAANLGDSDYRGMAVVTPTRPTDQRA